MTTFFFAMFLDLMWDEDIRIDLRLNKKAVSILDKKRSLFLFSLAVFDETGYYLFIFSG